MRGVTLVFRRSESQEAVLQELLAAQQDPASPEFHHWLTAETFGQRFGTADEDLEATKNWLTGQGFEINGISRAHDRISFSGTALQVETAFATSLHHYQIDGQLHTSPNSNLSLPADLAPMTAAVLHLSDFRPVPKARLSPHPAYSTADTKTHFLTPPDLAVMYDLPKRSNSYYPGDGQSIAIVGQSYVDLSLNSIVRKFLTSTVTLKLTPVLVPGSGVQAISPVDASESELDLEYASGLLNSANIFLVYVGSDPSYNVFDALSFAIDQNIAPVISISYGECETLLSPAEIEQGNALFQQAASQGQTLIAASGDAGSTACAAVPISSHLSATQQQALAVDFPADSPFVIAVGGTQMSPETFAASNSVYWTAATPPYDLTQSLLSYVPETTWNEDSATNGIFAGGGGASATLPRPPWQAVFPGMPAGNTRVLPDIAFQASSTNPGFLVCTDDPSFFIVGQNSGCGYGLVPAASYPLAGGTSFAAPIFAAMVALLNQDTQSLGQGNLNPILYRLASSATTAASVFHDIASGSIACTAGIPGCSAAGQSGFAATAGYDQATGLGSLDYLHLLAAWPTSHPALDATVTSLYPFNTAIDTGATDVIGIFVTSVFQSSHAATPPSGGVSVAVDGTIVVQNLAFSNFNLFDSSGRVSYSLTAPMTPGSHVVVITYPGDRTHGPSTSTTSILVGNVLASGGIALAAGNVTLPPNGSAITNVVVTPTGGYGGRLTWSLSLSGGTGSSLTVCYSIPSPLVQGVTSVALSLGAGAACSSALPTARAVLSAAAADTPARLPPLKSWQSGPVVAGLLLCCLRLRTRAPRSISLLCMLLIAAASTLSGCGGSNSNANSGSGSTASPPNPITTYTATLTGRDSVNTGISSSTTFTLTLR